MSSTGSIVPVPIRPVPIRPGPKHRCPEPVARVRLRLFAGAREAAGRSEDQFEASTLGDVLGQARVAYGEPFTSVLGTARVWVNGDEPADGDATIVNDDDEVAVLPPVSGG